MYAELKKIGSKSWVPQALSGLFIFLIIMEWVLGMRSLSALNFANSTDVNLPIAKQVRSKSRDYASILKMALFGDYIPENLADADVKQSALHVSLVGVIWAADEKDSIAIIQLPNHEEQLFHLGDDVPGGAVIKRIQADGIFMIRNGGLESLSLPEKELTFDPPSPPMH